MRTLTVVVLTPGLDQLSRFLQAREPVFIQAAIPKPCIEAFYKRILHGLAGFNKTESDLRFLRPLKHRPTRQFRAIVHHDLLGKRMALCHLIEIACQPQPRKEKSTICP